MVIGPLCEAAKPLGHSWPSLHWWLSLTAADQGAWASGIGTFVAALVALGIALTDGRRRRVEGKSRARLAMASLYSPVSGIYAMVQSMGNDAVVAAAALPGDAVRQVAHTITQMKTSGAVVRDQFRYFTPQEAIYLPKDFGPSLAAAIRDAELLESMVTSAADRYLHGLRRGKHNEMHAAARSLVSCPDYAKSIIRRLDPFLVECQKRLGEIAVENFDAIG